MLLFVSVFLVSCSVFTQSIKIISPIKEIELEKGTEFVVRWDLENFTAFDFDLKIELIGKKNYVILESIKASKKEYKWKVEVDSGEYKIILSGGDLKSESETFLIVEKKKFNDETTLREKNEVESPNTNETVSGTDNEEGKSVFLTITGDFQNATSIQDTKNSSVTNGSIGMKIVDKKKETDLSTHNGGKVNKLWEASISITLASTNDTIKENYGSSLLISKKGVTSAYFQVLIFEPFKKMRIFKNIPIVKEITDAILKYNDFGIYVGYSNAVWKKDSTFISKATNVAIGVYANYDFARYFIPKDLDNKDIKCSIGAGFTYRSIVGDLSFEKNDSLRMAIFGTDQRKFFGPELRATIGYKNFLVTASYIYLYGDRVEGLSRGQFLTSFSFSADVRL